MKRVARNDRDADYPAFVLSRTTLLTAALLAILLASGLAQRGSQICNLIMEDVRVRFGRALRERCHMLGVSQEGFADLCGLDRTYVGGIERGERNVALVNIEKLAKALKISLSEFFRSV